jgi:hypothetical protein
MKTKVTGKQLFDVLDKTISNDDLRRLIFTTIKQVSWEINMSNEKELRTLYAEKEIEYNDLLQFLKMLKVPENEIESFMKELFTHDKTYFTRKEIAEMKKSCYFPLCGKRIIIGLNFHKEEEILFIGVYREETENDKMYNFWEHIDDWDKAKEPYVAIFAVKDCINCWYNDSKTLPSDGWYLVEDENIDYVFEW